jgi:hypothetical protein
MQNRFGSFLPKCKTGTVKFLQLHPKKRLIENRSVEVAIGLARHRKNAPILVAGFACGHPCAPNHGKTSSVALEIYGKIFKKLLALKFTTEITLPYVKNISFAPDYLRLFFRYADNCAIRP